MDILHVSLPVSPLGCMCAARLPRLNRNLDWHLEAHKLVLDLSAPSRNHRDGVVFCTHMGVQCTTIVQEETSHSQNTRLTDAIRLSQDQSSMLMGLERS